MWSSAMERRKNDLEHWRARINSFFCVSLHDPVNKIYGLLKGILVAPLLTNNKVCSDYLMMMKEVVA